MPQSLLPKSLLPKTYCLDCPQVTTQSLLPGLPLLFAAFRHSALLLLGTETHTLWVLMCSTVAQVAARELRAAAKGGSSKLVAQHSAAWAQRTIQVEA